MISRIKESLMKTGDSWPWYRSTRRIGWVILTHTLGWVFAITLQASTSSWTVLGVQDMGLKLVSSAAVSSDGEIYSSAFGGVCPAPTLTVGDTSQFSSCVTKTNTSGNLVFSVRIGGANVKALVLDAEGNPYIAGSTGSGGAPGFVTTLGAYESSPPNELDAFVCKLGNTDGHPVFCTFVDVGLIDNNAAGSISNPGFNVDSAGNSYLAGWCGDFQHVCAEKLNSTGTARAYLTSLSPNAIPSPIFHIAYVATDGNLNMCIAQADVGITMLNGSGAVMGKVANLGSDLPVGLAFNPVGYPEILLQDSADVGHLHMRRYTPDLSAILFDTSFFAGNNPAIGGWESIRRGSPTRGAASSEPI